MFIFYSVRGRKQLPWPLWQKDPFQSLFCSLTPLVFRISPHELWVLFFLRVSCGLLRSPLQTTQASSSPLTAFFSHTSACFPFLASPGSPRSLSLKLFSRVIVSRHYWKLPQTLQMRSMVNVGLPGFSAGLLAAFQNVQVSKSTCHSGFASSPSLFAPNPLCCPSNLTSLRIPVTCFSEEPRAHMRALQASSTHLSLFCYSLILPSVSGEVSFQLRHPQTLHPISLVFHICLLAYY